MADRTTADQLVQTAYEAMMSNRATCRRDARRATAAVLRELAGWPRSGRRDHGCYWSPESLRDLADHIDQEARRDR